MEKVVPKVGCRESAGPLRPQTPPVSGMSGQTARRGSLNAPWSKRNNMIFQCFIPVDHLGHFMVK
jgi:hypothetical protein